MISLVLRAWEHAGLITISEPSEGRHLLAGIMRGHPALKAHQTHREAGSTDSTPAAEPQVRVVELWKLPSPLRFLVPPSDGRVYFTSPEIAALLWASVAPFPPAADKSQVIPDALLLKELLPKSKLILGAAVPKQLLLTSLKARLVPYHALEISGVREVRSGTPAPLVVHVAVRFGGRKFVTNVTGLKAWGLVATEVASR